MVVDPNFGERLASLPLGVSVWIIDTPINKAVANRLRKARANLSHLTGITTYNIIEDASPEENLLEELDMIDLHHPNPPFTRIEIFGAHLSDNIKLVFADYGFDQFLATADGFAAIRQSPASKT